MQERKPITVCIRDFKSGHARISVLIGLMIDNKHCFFFFKIRERERERERDRQTDRQTDRHTDREREGGGSYFRVKPSSLARTKLCADEF